MDKTKKTEPTKKGGEPCGFEYYLVLVLFRTLCFTHAGYIVHIKRTLSENKKSLKISNG
jgi:hypothetical protein